MWKGGECVCVVGTGTILNLKILVKSASPPILLLENTSWGGWNSKRTSGHPKEEAAA